MLRNKVSAIVVLPLALWLSSVVSADALRDPTLPSQGAQMSAATGATSQWRLSSVVNSGNRAYAVIDNKIYSLGDRVHGVKIVTITDNTVSLSDGRKLSMFPAVTEK